MARITSLGVKAGALLVVLALDPQFSIDLQLIGGVIILQTLPALVLGLWRTFAHRWALLAGWAVGPARGAADALRHAEPGDRTRSTSAGPSTRSRTSASTPRSRSTRASSPWR